MKSNFSVLKYEKDITQANLTEFFLKGFLHALQFKRLQNSTVTQFRGPSLSTLFVFVVLVSSSISFLFLLAAFLCSYHFIFANKLQIKRERRSSPTNTLYTGP